MPLNVIDLIVIAIVVLILVAASAYIIRAKKKGVKCIGCPDGCKCSGGDGSSCSGGCAGCNGH